MDWMSNNDSVEDSDGEVNGHLPVKGKNRFGDEVWRCDYCGNVATNMDKFEEMKECQG